MIFYDSIHETCITMPCKEDVKEGQLCAFDSNYGVRHADFGESPHGVVKYVRDGLATVQIHGLVTLPYALGKTFSLGYTGLVTDNTFCGVQSDSEGTQFLVVKNDLANREVTIFLG